MPDRKTQKKKSPGQKYKYPPEFLTKSGTIKKNMRKQAMEFRKTHNQDGTPLLSRSVSHSELEPEPEGLPVSPGSRDLGPAPEEDTSDEAFMNRHRRLENLERRGYLVDEGATRRYGDMLPPHPSSVEAMRRARRSQFDDIFEGAMNRIDRRSSAAQDDSVEDVGELPYLPDDLIQKFLDEIVFQNEPRGPMNPERCRRLRQFCQLYPRTCAFNEDFKRAFVYPCTKQGRSLRNPSAYREYSDFMEALPELRRDAERSDKNPYLYRHQNRRYGHPLDNQDISPGIYVRRYLTPTELNKRSRKLGMMKPKVLKELVDLLRNPYGLTWKDLRRIIYDNPERLDDIIADFKMRLQSLKKSNGVPLYTEKYIDLIIKRFIEELYD